MEEKKTSFLDKAKKNGIKPSSHAPKARDENFMDKLIKSRADMCYKVSGRDSTGREAYYFILIDKEKKEQFLKHTVGDTYNLEDYGKIIYSAYGTVVPQEVKEMLKEKYGFDNLDSSDADGIYFSSKDLEEDEEK
jgi:hypothetical protein